MKKLTAEHLGLNFSDVENLKANQETKQEKF